MMTNWFRSGNNFLTLSHCYFCTYRQSIPNDYVRLLTPTSPYKTCEPKKLNNDNEYSESFLCLIISCKGYYLTAQTVTRGKSLKKGVASETPKSVKTTSQGTSQSASQTTAADTYSETVDTGTVSTPLQSTTGYVQSNSQSSPPWPSLDLNDDDRPKGLAFFRVNTRNIVNFQVESNAMWRPGYLGSENFAWNDDHERKEAVNLYVIGRLGWSNLTNAESLFGPSYRLQLQLDSVTASALKHILDNGPLKDVEVFRSPLLGHSAVFSSKAIDLRKDAPDLDPKDPFPFLFDGRETRSQSVLINYPAEDFSADDLVVVETNISSYNVPKRDESSPSMGYKLLLRAIFFLGHGFNASNKSSPKTLKRPGESLVSPRKNKKAGDIAFFSDED